MSHIAPHSENRNHSQLSRTIHQPTTQLSRYPLEVLCTLEDCKDDPDVRTTSTNASRPPMEQAICHEDGTMILLGEWATIKATARLVKMELLALPAPRDRRAKGQKKTKIYFRSFHRTEWEAAIQKMESQQPLLALCTAHWKADHVLGNTLLVPINVPTGDLDDTGDVDELDATPESTKLTKSAEGKKRSGNHQTCRAKKVKTGKEAVRMKTTAIDALQSDGEHGKPLTLTPM